MEKGFELKTVGYFDDDFDLLNSDIEIQKHCCMNRIS